jgi:phage recombination protein Bet
MGRTPGAKNRKTIEREQAMATQTADRTETVADEATSKGEVAVFSPPRLPFHPRVEEAFNVDRGTWKVLVEAIFPTAKTADAIVMALSYCKSRGLDIMKRPVHIVPMWDSARGSYVETVWPGISEIRTTAARTREYAGCDAPEFGKSIKMHFKGRVKRGGDWKDEAVEVEFPEHCRMTVYRIVQGTRVAFVGPKVSWLETYATQGNTELPNKMWQERPEGQLEKCAEAAALRRAFPEETGNELTAEEMAGRHVGDLTIETVAIPDQSTVNNDAAPPRSTTKADATSEVRDGTPPRQVDAAPPRQQQAKKPEPKQEPKPDPISTGRATAAMHSSTEETKPHRIPGDGHSYESWAQRFQDLVKTSADTNAVYKWVDENTKKFTLPGVDGEEPRQQAGPLERLQKMKPSIYAAVRKTLEETIESLRDKAAKAEAKKAGPAPSDMSDSSGEMDDDAGEPEASEYGKPANDNPETVLKWIEATLASIDQPEDLETIWETHCLQHLVDMIPPDKEEAMGIYRKHERRLEP